MPWVVRLLGDKNIYANPANPKKQVNYGIVVVRSLQWPGSYTFYTQGRFLSVYVGSGLKYETQTYYPIHPPLIMEDPGNNWIEQPEPTPLFEEVVQQQDLDDVNPDDQNDENQEGEYD